MRIAFFTVGSHGDVNPFLAVARELVTRGHEVSFYATAYFANDARESGITFHPLSAELDVEKLLRDPDLMHRRKGGRKVFQLLYDGIPEMIAATRREIESNKPDVIVAHQITFGARWVAQQLGVPVALCSLSPMMWLNHRDPVRFFQQQPGKLGRFAAGAATPLMKLLARVLIYPRFNELRKANGFPPLADPFIDEFCGGDLNLGLWSPHLRPALEGDPPRTHVTGFAWHDRSHANPLAPELEAFLDAGPPPIVFTLGTAAVHTAGDYYHLAIDAARQLNRRAILLTGKREYAPTTVPANMLALPYAPFSLLFPRAAVNIHHAGIGSTAQSLRAGRPVVAVPHAHDQFNNAVRIRNLGFGAITPRHRLTARRFADAIAQVLDNPAAESAARHFSQRLQHEHGAAVAADHIERLARSGPALSISENRP